ncbi:hypothetical protein M6B38_390790 [Iris pallida]|uniref:Uncharacterized protein n=1 Tax=Iris pallida TaxID=29817 RepID=A0AAX6G040_IRIPA|nr:hypothetical protein M6B38_390790 [Iris pallida]
MLARRGARGGGGEELWCIPDEGTVARDGVERWCSVSWWWMMDRRISVRSDDSRWRTARERSHREKRKGLEMYTVMCQNHWKQYTLYNTILNVRVCVQ